MEIDLELLKEKLDFFFNTVYSKKVKELLASYPDRKSIYIDYFDLVKNSPELVEILEKYPDAFLSAAKEVLKLYGTSIGKEFLPNVRISGVSDKGLLIQDIKAESIDGLITFKGIITKRTEVMHRVERAVLVCSLCRKKYKFHMTKNSQLPTRCESCRKGMLELVEDESGFVDLQKGEAQELLERVRGGTPAARIELLFEDDLVNKVNPGDNVQITGIMRIKQLATQKKPGHKSTLYTKFIDVIDVASTLRDFEEIEITEEEERKIIALSRDKNIVQRMIISFAPGIYGHEEVKHAILLQMFGGTKEKYVQNMRLRDDIHLLLIGDHGAAKTRFLQYVNELAPKSIYVSGKSITGVGLTASAERDELSDGGWTLKAGALVLASGGIACVDEFDKIDDKERAAMHEVMESQTVSVAKAGIVTKFKAKTAILAAANPKRGRFDPNRPPAEQFDIPPTLLSRFDLIFPILDIMDEERDSKLAQHILERHYVGAAKGIDKELNEGTLTSNDIIEPYLLTKYIAYARKNIKPVLSKEAMDKIREYYVELRKIGKQQGAVPITARQIEGLIRLSEASAKMRLSNIVEEVDAENAIKLMDYVLNKILVDRETGRFDVDIIATGQPKSKIQKYDVINNIIKKLQGKEGDAEIQKIIEIAQSDYGIDENTCRRIIDELITRGELYKSRAGHVKIVETE